MVERQQPSAEKKSPAEAPKPLQVVGITGGAGYLGLALARRLADVYRVRILDLKRPPLVDEHPNVEFRMCDVLRREECLSALEGVDAVFHRAGLMGNLASMREPMNYYRVNLLGTLNVLEACVARGVRRFLFDSTVAVYGRRLEGPISEADRPEPNSIYGATKLACEAAIKMYDARHGLPGFIFRYSRTRSSAKHDAISILAKKLLNGEPVTLYDGGEPIIDFVELDDVIEANVRGLTSPLRGEVVNISSGEGISFSGLLAAIERCVGRRATAVTFEQLPEHPPISEHRFGSKKFYMSIEKAQSILGWTPARRLESSIAGTVAILKGGSQ